MRYRAALHPDIDHYGIASDVVSMDAERRNLLHAGAARLGIELGPDQLEQFARFHALLYERNRIMNLTRVSEEDAVGRHYLESLSIAALVHGSRIPRILDLGAGGGFPGVPLCIAYPCSRITLIDATAKKVRFLQEALQVVGIRNAEAVHARAESLARDSAYRARFDLVVARAVAPLDRLIPWAIPFLRDSGRFIAYLAALGAEEAERSPERWLKLGARLTEVRMCSPSDGSVRRGLAVFSRAGKRDNGIRIRA